MIFILTGNVRTGKTSALLKWAKARNDIDGVLCPDDENGKRYFLNILSKETIPLEVEKHTANDRQIISVGPFNFLNQSFQKANHYLIQAANIKSCKYLVIDELGKLELKNKGLYDSTISIIDTYQSDEIHHLVLVVRTSLIQSVIEYYTISKYQLINKTDLSKLD